MKPSPKPQLEKRKDTIEYKEGDPYIIITMSKEADKHAQGKQERKKVYCGGDHCSGLWNLPCNAPEHPRVEPLQARKECEIRIMDGWCWTHSRHHCTQEPGSKQEWKKVIDGVFLHGRETPELSYNLPDGQYTVAQAIELIDQELAQAREEGRREAVEEIKHLYYNCEDSNGFHANEFWEGLDHLQERNK